MADMEEGRKTAVFAGYPEFLCEIKHRVLTARVSAARAVNRALILLYWDIGRGIVERQKTLGWGESVVEALARDLKSAFPGTRGFSTRNIWEMRRFFESYSRPAILQQAVAELGKSLLPKVTQGFPSTSEQFLQQLVADVPWGHHLTILHKVRDAPACLYYLRATAKLG